MGVQWSIKLPLIWYGFALLRFSGTVADLSKSLWSILLRQHDIREDDTVVRRFLQREAELYRVDAEVEYLDKRSWTCSWGVLSSVSLCCNISYRSWWHSQTLRRWSEYVASCWKSWTRAFAWGHRSSTTALNAWVKWGIRNPFMALYLFYFYSMQRSQLARLSAL